MSYQDIPGRNVMRPIYEHALRITRPGGIWVEVGVALGRGIAEMARVLLDAGREDVRLFAVDPWAATARNGEQHNHAPPSPHVDWEFFLDHMQRCAPAELRRIHILRAPSSAAAKIFLEQSCDLVILDADHTEDAVTDDIRAWLPRVRVGGLIGGDDHHPSHFPGVEKACRKFFGAPGEGYEVADDNAHRWPIWWRVVDGKEVEL